MDEIFTSPFTESVSCYLTTRDTGTRVDTPLEYILVTTAGFTLKNELHLVPPFVKHVNSAMSWACCSRSRRALNSPCTV